MGVRRTGTLGGGFFSSRRGSSSSPWRSTLQRGRGLSSTTSTRGRIPWSCRKKRRIRVLLLLGLILLLMMMVVLGIYVQWFTTLLGRDEWDDVVVMTSPRAFSVDSSYFAADPDKPTIAIDTLYKQKQGFYNQQMAFTRIIMRIVDMMTATSSDTTTEYQVLLPSLAFMDYLGSGKRVPFERLFNVAHWNSIPGLPRLVSYNATQHYQYSLRDQSFRNDNNTPYTHPYRLDHVKKSFQEYVEIMNNVNDASQLHPADRLILQEGALRPHPVVREFVDQIVSARGDHGVQRNHSVRNDYVALHARVEPDFLCHPFPTPVEHGNLTRLLERLERTWPDPPATRCFIAVNRPLLESRDAVPARAKPSIGRCQAERLANLEALNNARRHGLWGGRVRVMERPSLQRQALFRDRPVVFASLMDAEICRRAAVFVGSLRSTFTINTIRRRSVAGNLQNFRYDADRVTQVHGAGYPKE